MQGAPSAVSEQRFPVRRMRWLVYAGLAVLLLAALTIAALGLDLPLGVVLAVGGAAAIAGVGLSELLLVRPDIEEEHERAEADLEAICERAEDVASLARGVIGWAQRYLAADAVAVLRRREDGASTSWWWKARLATRRHN